MFLNLNEIGRVHGNIHDTMLCEMPETNEEDDFDYDMIPTTVLELQVDNKKVFINYPSVSI